MKFRILASELKAVMTIAGAAVAKNEVRPILRAVNCRIENNELIATGIDGYKMHQLRVPCEVLERNDDFAEFNIKPLKEIKSGLFNYFVEVTDESISYLNEVDNMKLEMPLMPGSFIKIDDILPKSEIVFSICVDPKMMQDTLRLYNKEAKVRLDFYSNNSPIMIHTKDSRAMIMPVRFSKEGGIK